MFAVFGKVLQNCKTRLWYRSIWQSKRYTKGPGNPTSSMGWFLLASFNKHDNSSNSNILFYHFNKDHRERFDPDKRSGEASCPRNFLNKHIVCLNRSLMNIWWALSQYVKYYDAWSIFVIFMHMGSNRHKHHWTYPPNSITWKGNTHHCILYWRLRQHVRYPCTYQGWISHSYKIVLLKNTSKLQAVQNKTQSCEELTSSSVSSFFLLLLNIIHSLNQDVLLISTIDNYLDSIPRLKYRF